MPSLLQLPQIGFIEPQMIPGCWARSPRIENDTPA